MAQGTGSHPCPWPKFITMFNYWRSLGNLIWPIAILNYSWGRVTNWGSLLLSRNKNFWYFLCAISGLKLGWTSELSFQSIAEALRITGPRMFMSLLLEDDLLPLIVLQQTLNTSKTTGRRNFQFHYKIFINEGTDFFYSGYHRQRTV